VSEAPALSVTIIFIARRPFATSFQSINNPSVPECTKRTLTVSTKPVAVTLEGTICKDVEGAPELPVCTSKVNTSKSAGLTLNLNKSLSHAVIISSIGCPSTKQSIFGDKDNILGGQLPV
jgi:hypothetical protein